MKTFKMGICFIDENDEVLSKRVLSSNWEVNDEEIMKSHFNVCMQEEVANILVDQMMIDLKQNKDIIRGMLDEIYKKEDNQ